MEAPCPRVFGLRAVVVLCKANQRENKHNLSTVCFFWETGPLIRFQRPKGASIHI